MYVVLLSTDVEIFRKSTCQGSGASVLSTSVWRWQT